MIGAGQLISSTYWHFSGAEAVQLNYPQKYILIFSRNVDVKQYVKLAVMLVIDNLMCLL